MTDRIYQWSDIAGDFTDGLVLGNGASIAISSRFTYSSLREEAEHRHLITPDVRRVFDDLATSDFELVLRVLWHASRVNQAFAIDERRTADAYRAVKGALIDVVRAVHPTYAEVEPHLAAATAFMGQFDTVIALSYDVLVYWAMLEGNRSSQNRFKDCWVSGEFRHDWRLMRQPFGTNRHATLVFYPHGNVVLGADITGGERKIASDENAALLVTITNQWAREEVTPLFVSEGTSVQKRASIRRSPYLSTVFDDVLPAIGRSVVVHGWAMKDEDDHLLQKLCQRSPKRLAVAVDPASPTLARDRGRIESKLEERLGHSSFELVWYDRTSLGCWVNPDATS